MCCSLLAQLMAVQVENNRWNTASAAGCNAHNVLVCRPSGQLKQTEVTGCHVA